MRYSNTKTKNKPIKNGSAFSQTKVIKEINRLAKRSNKQFEMLLYQGLPIH